VTYQSGWYVEAPVYTTTYLACDRQALDALLRKSPQLALWCVIPVGSQYLIEERCESSLARVQTASIDYRVDAALARKIEARNSGDHAAAARYDALVKQMLTVFPTGEMV
jgi:hypothetical protein